MRTRRACCEKCLRRSWLLSRLSILLNYSSRDCDRLLALLELGDEELVQAIGGRRRRELTNLCERFRAEQVEQAPGVNRVCRHGPDYPRALRSWAGAPAMLHVIGQTKRLRELTAGPVVAIVGATKASDYGMEMARSFARGLAASGVTVVSAFADGIAAAAHAGALEADGPTVSVMAGGVDVCKPAGRRELCERVKAHGCAVAELPCGAPVPRWGGTACARTVAGLAELTIVIEAEESSRELVGARVAKALDRTVAALPGRVTSPLSQGTCALLMQGAPLVRGPADALDLLYGAGPRRPGTPHERRPAMPEPAKLEPRLRAMLEHVGAGRDTPGKLTGAGADPGEAMLALSELELMGLLGRGDGGRYVPRESLAGW
jgi:DNA processing protein